MLNQKSNNIIPFILYQPQSILMEIEFVWKTQRFKIFTDFIVQHHFVIERLFTYEH